MVAQHLEALPLHVSVAPREFVIRFDHLAHEFLEARLGLPA
jgi:hypothetical protein